MIFVRRRMHLMLASVVVVGCGSGGGFPDAPEIDAPPLPGAFTLAWSVTDLDGAEIACDAIGAQSVTALLRNRGVQGGSTEVFTCATEMGRSQDLTPGTYDIDFELVGPGGVPPTGVVSTAPRQDAVEIGAGQTVALAPLTFAIDPRGGLALNLTANAAGNCAPIATGGAGITTMTLTLERASDLSCAPVTFDISAGATGQARTYTVDCAAPVPTPCIEADQQLTVTGMAAGNYLIHVRGTTTEPAECRINDDTLPVPGLGRDLTRTLNLGIQATGC